MLGTCKQEGAWKVHLINIYTISSWGEGIAGRKGSGGTEEKQPSKPVSLGWRALVFWEETRWSGSEVQANCKVLPFFAVFSVCICPPGILEEEIGI